MPIYNIYISFVFFSTHLAVLIVNILRFLLVTIASISPMVAFILIIAVFILILQIPYLGSISVMPYVILMALGLVKKDSTWSVVYDSKTKLPIDPAYIIVRNMQGTELSTIITDLSGRFSLLLPRGLYVIEANKTNYSFPSNLMASAHTDGKYENLYFASVIEVKEEERSINISIPMDPVSEDWNQVEKKRKKLFYQFDDPKTYAQAAKIYSLIAVALLFCRLVVYQSSGLFDDLILSIVVAIIVYVYTRHTRQYSHSIILEKDTHKPLAFARVNIFSAKTKNKVAHKTTSYEGQFTCLLPKGNYYLTIERRDDRGMYELAFTSDTFSVNDGYIGKRFLI